MILYDLKLQLWYSTLQTQVKENFDFYHQVLGIVEDLIHLILWSQNNLYEEVYLENITFISLVISNSSSNTTLHIIAYILWPPRAWSSPNLATPSLLLSTSGNKPSYTECKRAEDGERENLERKNNILLLKLRMDKLKSQR